MEANPSSNSYLEDEKSDLEYLFDAFSSVVSLEDIALAYCQSGCDICIASDILFNRQGSTSGASNCAFKYESEGLSMSSECSNKNLLEHSNFAERNSISSKQKKCSASMGTVSGVIGREYAQHKLSRNESCKVNKPLKLNSEELPISEIWGEKVTPNMTDTVESTHKDTEEFLFKMLGNGFQLDMKTIQEVLGLSGYDVINSMDKLLDLSASTLEMADDVYSLAAQKPMEKYSDTKSPARQGKSQCKSSARSDNARLMSRNESPKSENNRYALQKEVLEALFIASERSEDATKRTRPVKEVRRSRGFGQVVDGPLCAATERKTAIAKLQVIDDENEDDDSYELLRKAVKEYWIIMKEYYKSAVDAHVKGDHARANKLLEQGHFFNEKARKADEKSAQKLLETRDEGISLDLLEHDPKEAIRLLKVYLNSLSGMPTIRYLKLMVGTNTEDAKEGARKRRIIKFLDKESIKWSEESNGQIIVVQLEEINRNRLSFAKIQKQVFDS